MELETILLILALVFGFYMAWNIGANDVANAMGTSVGSGALTLRRAILLAALLEFCGAYFVGSSVSDTVRKGIVDPDLFVSTPMLFVYGMLASLLAAGVWLQIATYFGWPVSTTHSIVGAIVGFGVVYGGMSAVHWDKVGTIAASWVVSPVLSGAISFVLFRLVLKTIFHSPNPVRAARRFVPYMVFIVFFVLALVMAFKGLKHVIDLPLGHSLLLATGAGAIAAIVSYFLARRIDVSGEEEAGDHARAELVDRSLRRATKHLRRVQTAASDEIRSDAKRLLAELEELSSTAEKRVHLGGSNPTLRRVERIFIYLQILSACFVAFAHGANDVANAIGPFSAAVQTLRDGVVAAKATVPPWALALGGIGIVIGLATWGWRVPSTGVSILVA